MCPHGNRRAKRALRTDFFFFTLSCEIFAHVTGRNRLRAGILRLETAQNVEDNFGMLVGGEKFIYEFLRNHIRIFENSYIIFFASTSKRLTRWTFRSARRLKVYASMSFGTRRSRF